jgi:RecA-family ATPase
MPTDKNQQPDRESISYISFQDLVKTLIELKWIIQGMISKGDATLIHATGGVGKSMLALYISLFLASYWTGEQDQSGLIFEKFPVPERRYTLFIQAENSHVALYRRIKAMCRGNQTFVSGLDRLFVLSQYEDTTITGEQFSDKKFCQFLVGYIGKLEKEQGLKIDLLIIDPLISYHGGNENDAVETRLVLDGISTVAAQTKTTPMVIHHNRKNGDEVRGSSGISDWARNRISLKEETSTKTIISKNTEGKTITSKQNIKRIRVTHEKCNNFEMFEPFLLEMDSNLCFKLAEEKLKPKDTEICKNVAQVLSNMGGHAESKNILAKAYKDEFGGSVSTAKRSVEKAANNGDIKKQSSTTGKQGAYEYSSLEN